MTILIFISDKYGVKVCRIVNRNGTENSEGRSGTVGPVITRDKHFRSGVNFKAELIASVDISMSINMAKMSNGLLIHM